MLDFYRKLGAEMHDEWKAASLEGDALERLAGSRR